MHPLPWYIAGPLIGLVVPALLLVGNKPFGISSNFRDLCAAVAPGRVEFFKYDWKRAGGWNPAFLAGIFVGAVAAWQLAPPLTVAISSGTVAALHQLGLNDLTGMAPREVFAWSSIPEGSHSMTGGGAGPHQSRSIFRTRALMLSAT